MPRARATAPTQYTCTFRVRIRGGFYAPPDARSIWRELELRADQTLADLGEAIPPAFGFDDDHLWSFFLSGKPWDRKSEYARIAADDLLEAGRKRPASQLPVREAPAGREFLFLFDYGDEWHFGVKLARTGEIEPGAAYPRVVSSVGDARRSTPTSRTTGMKGPKRPWMRAMRPSSRSTSGYWSGTTPGPRGRASPLTARWRPRCSTGNGRLAGNSPAGPPMTCANSCWSGARRRWRCRTRTCRG